MALTSSFILTRIDPSQRWVNQPKTRGLLFLQAAEPSKWSTWSQVLKERNYYASVLTCVLKSNSDMRYVIKPDLLSNIVRMLRILCFNEDVSRRKRFSDYPLSPCTGIGGRHLFKVEFCKTLSSKSLMQPRQDRKNQRWPTNIDE